MSDATEDQAADSLFPVEWPAQSGPAAESFAPGDPGAPASEPGEPGADAGSGALPPIFPPLAPIPPAQAAPPGASSPAPSDAPSQGEREATPAATPAGDQRPSALDVETAALRVRRSALDIETTVLGSRRPAADAETERLGRPSAALDGASERPAPPHPALTIETERLSGTYPAPDPEADRLRRERSGLDQQDTERLTREQLAAQIETERLKRATAIDQEETERLKRGTPVDQEETEPLKRGSTPLTEEETARIKRSGDIYINPPARPWAEHAVAPYYQPGGQQDAEPFYAGPLNGVRDEEALQEEATAALSLFASAPSMPEPVLPAPSLPQPLTPDHPTADEDTAKIAAPVAAPVAAPLAGQLNAGRASLPAVAERGEEQPAPARPLSGRPDESLVRALRREMFPRLSLGKRALALLSQPDVALMLLFAVAQIVFAVMMPWGGAQPAEAQALTQAARIARGDGIGVLFGAFGQLNGAPLWAVFAGAGGLLGGLMGARVVAILCVASAGLATARAAKNLFGRTAGVFTAALFAISGPLLFSAHLAIPDQLTLLGAATSLWAITQAEETRRKEWLLFAAAAFCIAVVAQFAALALLIPLGLVALALRARPSSTIFAITGLVAVALLVSRFAPPPVAVFTLLPARGAHGLTLSASVSAAGLELLILGMVAWGTALAGWMAAHDQGRLAGALFTGLVFAPVSMALMGGAPDAAQRMVSGLLFGLPLMGVALTTLWLGPERLNLARRALVVALLLAICAVGVLQANGIASPGGLRPTYSLHAGWGKATAPTPPRAARAVAKGEERRYGR